jgi:hypothetical protein
MDKYNMYDVLDVGSIWRSKRHGHLHVVLALANFSLPEKYLKTNPPQVIFSDGNQVLATTADRFLSLRNYVRQDDSIKNAFFNMAAMPITEEEREPSLQLYNEEDAVEENELIVDEEQTSTRTLAASAEEKPQIIKVNVNTDADDVKEKLNAANVDFINYRQLRTVDSIYYHTISVSSIDYVQTIVNNIYEIESIEILINGRIKIDIANPQITTAYTEVCNNKPVYSITFADASQATEAYEEVQPECIQPDAANDQQQAENESQYTTNALSSILSAVAEDIYRSGSSSENNDAAEITANNSSIESEQKDDSHLGLDFEQGIVIAEPAEKLTEELVNDALTDKPEEDNSLETEAKLDAEVENTAEIDEADDSKVEAGSEVNEVISTEGISLSNEHESSEVVIEDAAVVPDEGSVATEEVEDEELSSNEETDVDELDEVTVDSNIAIVDDDVDSNSAEETDYVLDHTLATDDSEEFSLDDTQPGQAIVVEQSADDKLVEKLENIVK